MRKGSRESPIAREVQEVFHRDYYVFGTSIWTMSSKSMASSSSTIVVVVAKKTRNNIRAHIN